jgi:SAM-dependent methyltransferase
MNYYGFSARDHLVLENMIFGRNMSVLEIGVGAGSMVRRIKNKVGEFLGIDISADLIVHLKSVYSGYPHMRFVCGEDLLKGKMFDRIFSTDTLEHVESPGSFFGFIGSHLKKGGKALVSFPNESEEKHHGISWVDNKSDIYRMVKDAGLRISRLSVVEKTFWHSWLKGTLWDTPKKIFSNSSKNIQVFDQTQAYRIMTNRSVFSCALSIYSNLMTFFAGLFPLYEYKDVGGSITDKVLLLILEKPEEDNL